MRMAQNNQIKLFEGKCEMNYLFLGGTCELIEIKSTKLFWLNWVN
jgi:hypothetical protein